MACKEHPAGTQSMEHATQSEEMSGPVTEAKQSVAGEIEPALDSLLATPEFDLTVEYTLIGSDSAIIGWTANGTKVGTSRPAQVSGVTVLQVSKGKIARESWYYDPVKAPF